MSFTKSLNKWREGKDSEELKITFEEGVRRIKSLIRIETKKRKVVIRVRESFSIEDRNTMLNILSSMERLEIERMEIGNPMEEDVLLHDFMKKLRKSVDINELTDRKMILLSLEFVKKTNEFWNRKEKSEKIKRVLKFFLTVSVVVVFGVLTFYLVYTHFLVRFTSGLITTVDEGNNSIDKEFDDMFLRALLENKADLSYLRSPLEGTMNLHTFFRKVHFDVIGIRHKNVIQFSDTSSSSSNEGLKEYLKELSDDFNEMYSHLKRIGKYDIIIDSFEPISLLEEPDVRKAEMEKDRVGTKILLYDIDHEMSVLKELLKNMTEKVQKLEPIWIKNRYNENLLDLWNKVNGFFSRLDYTIQFALEIKIPLIESVIQFIEEEKNHKELIECIRDSMDIIEEILQEEESLNRFFDFFKKNKGVVYVENLDGIEENSCFQKIVRGKLFLGL